MFLSDAVFDAHVKEVPATAMLVSDAAFDEHVKEVLSEKMARDKKRTDDISLKQEVFDSLNALSLTS